MRILISGNSRGIGQAITEHFSKLNYDVIGYSRTKGLDLSKNDIRQQFVTDSADCDVIVINANISFDCVDLLYNVWYKNLGKDKTIVVLGSRRTEVLTTFPMKYQIEKIAIEETARQLQNSKPLPHVVLLRPGYVNTGANSHITTKMTSPTSVAELLEWILVTNKTKDFKILNILFAPN